ncbi:ATP-binding protein [Geobacter sp.]|uniref:ATP-binding protein n=1 Tax=Geobacter sp. TaxID=46610 RepID=UPI0026220858|nr:ATP-binding protein [Geobacter sp.]
MRGAVATGMKTRISVAVSVLIVTIIAALSFVALTFFRQEIRRNASDQQFVLVSALAAELDDKLATAQGELVAVAASFPRDFSRAQEYLDSRQDTRLIFDNCVALIVPSGRMSAISPFEPDMLRNDYSGREYFLRTMESGRPHISKPFITFQKRGMPIINLTAPLLDKRGRIEAILIGSIDLTRHNFLGKLAHLRLGKGGYVYLYDSDRTMIMHPDADRIMRKDVPPGANMLFDRALKGFEGSGETVNSRGVAMLASFKRLRTTGWIMAASTPLSEAYGSVNKAKVFLETALAVSALLSVALVWGLMNFLTVPLASFTRHVQEFSLKKGGARFFHRYRQDEIGILAAAFNRMIEALDRENEALARSEAMLAESQRLAHVGNWELDVATGTITWSDEMYRITGLAPGTFSGTREEFIGLVSPHEREVVENAAAASLRNEAKFNLEHNFVRPDGTERTVHAEAEVFFDGDGKPVRVFGTVKDITERKKVEEALRESERKLAAKHDQLRSFNAEREEKSRALEKAYAELKATHAQMLQQEKMASIGQLAAGVAHEINNPIGFISSNLGTLRKYVGRLVDYIGFQGERLAALSLEVATELAQKRQALKLDYIFNDTEKLIDESLEGTERVRKIVADLKSFSRVDDAETKLADINECLESTLNIAWNEIKYKATVKKELGDIPAVRCNPQQLNQVFLNLLVNAAHAIEGQGEIGVGTTHEGKWIAIRVSDTGCGIPEEIRGRIFEPFFTTKEVGVGTGLGLSISYDIVRKHGGEISVESEPGNGTTFTVLIPVTQQAS